MSLRRAFVAFADPHARAFDRHRCIGATLRVIHADEPITEWCPITVSPPRIVALA